MAEIARYDVKGFKNNEWHYLGSEYLDAYHTPDQKKETLKMLRKKHGEDYSPFNVSNFFNVYL
jgi:hypothetical protein